MAPLQVGILSAANIANVFCAAAAGLDTIAVAAVASRDPSRARAFADRHAIPRCCTYDELLSDASIDAVYIPLPTGLATPFAVRAAAAGKHVLVDKPFDSAQGMSEICDAALKSNVVFLDGTHFVHSKRIEAVRSALADFQRPVEHLCVSFTMPVDISAPGAIRANPKLEPAGALGDLGWYCIRAATAILGAETCGGDLQRVHCMGHLGRHGVLESAAGCVKMSSGASLTFDCGFNGPCRQRIEAVTSVGTVIVPDFVLPIGNSGPWDGVRPAENGTAELGFTVERTCRGEGSGSGGGVAPVWPETKHVAVEEGRTQATAMLEAFCRLVQGGAAEREQWMKETLATQRILDACLADALAAK